MTRESLDAVLQDRVSSPSFYYCLTFFVQFLRISEKRALIYFLSFLIATTVRSQVVINEIGIAPLGGNSTGGEFIELFNRSACAIDLSCYTIVFSSTTGSGNPSGWTIKIPSGNSIPSGGYFVIGGVSGQAGIVGGTGYPTGGTPRPFLGTANLDIGTLSSTVNSVYMLQGLNPVTFTDAGGQLTVLNNSGSVVSSVSYGAGNNPGSYPLSAYTSCNPSGNVKGVGNVPDPGNSSNNVGAMFSSAVNQGLYLDATGAYQATNVLTPGSANQTQIGYAFPLNFVSATSNSPLCEGTTLNLTSNASGGTGALSYSWTGPNGFSSSLQNPFITNVQTAANGSFTVQVTDANGCAQSASISVTINALPLPIIIYHN